MNLNWSNRVIKYVLFVFNLLFVISGIIMIAVGVSVKSYYTDYDLFLNDSYFSLPNLLIATGSLIFFISFFGCCGAVKESWFMIFIFSILLSVIFILEFSAGIAGYVLRDKTTSYLEDELLASMKSYQFYKDKDPNGETKLWDAMQFEFQCCGANGPQDWQKVPHKPPSTTAFVSTTASIKPIPTTTSGGTTVSSTTTTTPELTTTATTTPVSSPTTTPVSSTLLVSLPLLSAIDKAADAPDLPTDLPASCCKSKPGAAGFVNCNLNDNKTATINRDGCVSAFGSYLKDHAVTLGGVGIAIALIQLFGVIFACHLTKQLKNGFYST